MQWIAKQITMSPSLLTDSVTIMNKHAFREFFVPAQGNVIKDTLSGLTVALALIPEAIAFALVANLSPFIGLYAAFFMCLITAVIGGRPGMISGATGSMAVVMASLVINHQQDGLGLLFATIILTGCFQILIGLCRLGKLIRMMPKPVMVGFVNGLAIVIFLAQLHQFKEFNAAGVAHWLQGSPLYWMIALVVVAMIITHYLPKFTKAIPGPLTAIIVVTVFAQIMQHFYQVHIRAVDNMMRGATSLSFPHLAWPHVMISWHTVSVIVPYALVLAIIGLSESLMTLSLIDERTNTRGHGNRECIAQGIANVVSGGFGTMGGCAMIGQSMINITSGGRGRLSGIIAGVFLLIFVLVAWPIIKIIPLAALVGVMFMVVYETFEWATFRFIRQIPLKDGLVIVTVTAVTVATNLAIAVLVGVIISSLVFAWETAKHIYADTRINEAGEKEYILHGPLFFASISHFKQLFHYESDPNEIIIDFKYSRVADHSAIDAIKLVCKSYTSAGKKVHLRHLSPECLLLLGKAKSFVEVNQTEDPDYHIATDVLG